MIDEKLIIGKKYTIIDLGYHIALPQKRRLTIKSAEYVKVGERVLGRLKSHILIFKKGKELYGCDWSITESGDKFLEVVARGGDVKNWK